jgi:hypothetical protein
LISDEKSSSPSHQTKPVINLVRKALIKVLKLCKASSKLNGDVEEWIKIMEALEEPTTSFRTKRRLVERYTNTQLRLVEAQ